MPPGVLAPRGGDAGAGLRASRQHGRGIVEPGRRERTVDIGADEPDILEPALIELGEAHHLAAVDGSRAPSRITSPTPERRHAAPAETDVSNFAAMVMNSMTASWGAERVRNAALNDVSARPGRTNDQRGAENKETIASRWS